MKQLSPNNSGFTLIEVIVAICILSLGLLGLLSVTTMVMKGNTHSKMVSTATNLAEDKIEELKNTSYSSLSGGTDYASHDGTIPPASTGTYFTRTWQVNANQPATNLTTVTVVVSWTWQGQSRNVTINTILSNTT